MLAGLRRSLASCEVYTAGSRTVDRRPLLTLPALVLAILRRWLVLALILAILPLLMVAAFFGFFAFIR